MLSDDVYKSRLRETIAALETWLDGLKAVAEVETARDAASWRAAVRPRATTACPFELVLRADQKFDIVVGPETYEDQPIETLEAIQPLLLAITRGELVTSMWKTSATATPVMVATRVMPGRGKRWFRSRTLRDIADTSNLLLIREDRHYAPYARGA